MTESLKRLLIWGAGVDHDCVLGRCVHIAPGARLTGQIQVGEGKPSEILLDSTRRLRGPVRDQCLP